MVSHFEVGKMYKCKRVPKAKLELFAGPMKNMLDCKARKCVQGDGQCALFEGMYPDIPGLLPFSWGFALKYFEEVAE